MLLDPYMAPSVSDPRDTHDHDDWMRRQEQVEEEIAFLVPRIASQVSVTRSQIEQVLRARDLVLLQAETEL